MPPHVVDERPLEAMWLVNELIQHETDAEKWWRHPAGFHLLADADMERLDVSGPPPGWENLPMHEGD